VEFGARAKAATRTLKLALQFARNAFCGELFGLVAGYAVRETATYILAGPIAGICCTPDLFTFDFAPPGGFVCAKASDAKNELTTTGPNISDKASRTIFILKILHQ